jgi:putative membrane protein
MPPLEALLAWFHFVCIFALVGTLVSEMALYRRHLDLARLTPLRRVDMWYGISAGLVILSGILRVGFGLKGAAFYLHNPIFWTKMGFFVAIALLSIPPTIHYIRLGGRADASGKVTVDPGGYRRMWALLGVEVVLLACIPFLAALLALGLPGF